MNSFRFYCSKVKREYYPSSSVRIFRKSQLTRTPVSSSASVSKKSKSLESAASEPLSGNDEGVEEYAVNPVKIQMISKNLHEQIFPQTPRNATTNAAHEKYIASLKLHGINIDAIERIQDVNIKLPQLRGKNIEEHFYVIAKEQIAPYEELLQGLMGCKSLPKRPSQWCFREGWTKYNPSTGEGEEIDYPAENALVLDVEVCVTEGNAPTMATAVGATNWYSWVSPQLLRTKDSSDSKKKQSTHNHGYKLSDLIPLGTGGPKVIVGHNVSYDRARLREQYLIKDTLTRFLDTMSLHVCVSGITSYQRAILKSKQDVHPEDAEWSAQSSLNSLGEVHRLYCGGPAISKEERQTFVEGSLDDIRAEFQSLMNYCASDVEATQRILLQLYPLFAERFPHPATLAGILEMGSAYLPVNSNWLRYINESDLAYEELSIEAKYHLSRRADEACALLQDEQYRKHLWLWSEDWSVQQLKLKRSPPKEREAKGPQSDLFQSYNLCEDEIRLLRKFHHLFKKNVMLPVRRPLLPGYPAWYRKLCEKPPCFSSSSTSSEKHWTPGATEISTGMQIASKLLSLCWEGYPLHYLRGYGWGFLVPFRSQHPTSTFESSDNENAIPIKELIEHCPVPKFASDYALESESQYALGKLDKDLQSSLGKRQFYSKSNKNSKISEYDGSGVWCDQILEKCCYFFKLPHKNGKSFRVGNPLARDFLNKFSENVLTSGDRENNSAKRVIEIARMMSYWRNNRDRILGQMVVWLPKDVLVASEAYMAYGAVCPQVVTCGTLTRRAMEPTWMTASNSQRERIGSELRAMVQAPKSYKIVGADVDSQELWIASVLGDAHECGIHGVTPLGWMTLSGTKANGTDMHSVTAKAVGISRTHAKVINYARIYGAGQNFAEDLLKQFNPTLSSTEAKSKATKMYAITKGKRLFRLKAEFHQEFPNRNYSGYEARQIALTKGKSLDEMFDKPYWTGGTESAMFNCLEKIAQGEKPETPFLKSRLSRALETSTDVNRFLPTRINWVVQSGAVDFLHLMMVSMRWLMGPHVRFCLSFHDELRYLVKDEMAYKAALAMHVTNLLTRAFCSSRIGLSDLPMSVAFFASVEVDTVLRKECTMDCKTPSNPHGLQVGYGIPPGESLNIHDSITKSGENDLSKWPWIK